jgi:hypothetical protein
VSCSGSVSGDDVAATTHGSATSTLAITNNKLYQYDNPVGIGTINGQGSGTMNLTITGNTMCQTLSGATGRSGQGERAGGAFYLFLCDAVLLVIFQTPSTRAILWKSK